MIDLGLISSYLTKGAIGYKIILLLVEIAVLILAYRITNYGIKGILNKRSKSKRDKENIVVFSNVLKSFYIVLSFLIIIFTLTGSFSAISLSAGLLTAALGWALQRPITGVAGWLMVLVKKPFQIGDYIFLGDRKGEVIDITLTHIVLSEIGGTIAGEDKSGRTIMIPNAKLFEQDIINYTFQDQYILDEVITSFTYESDLKKAEEICLNSAKKITKNILNKVPLEPFIRLGFQPSGIDVKIRYYTKTDERQKIATDITREIFKEIRKNKHVEIAYPHTEIVYKK